MRHLRSDPDPRRGTAGRAGRRPRADERRDGRTAARTTAAPTSLRALRSERDASASSTSRAATSRSRTRTARSGRSRTASSTTTPRSVTTCGAAVTASRAAATRRSCRTCTRNTARCSREQLRGMFGDRGLGSGASPRRHRARPARDQADLLRRLRRLARLRLRAQEPARQRARPERSRLRGDRRVPLARVLPGAGNAAGRCQEARARLHPRDRERRGRGAAVLELSASRRSSAAAASRSGASACWRSSRSPFGMRLMSDVPLGAMLSGGLDSSLIVALMAKQMDRPVDTFAVGFKEAGASNELADARFVADALGAEPPRARALVRRRDDPARPPRLASRRAARRPLLARLHRALGDWLRSTSPSRSPARAPTSCSAATESTARLRSPTRGSACPARCGAPPSQPRPTAPSRLRRPVATLAAPGAAERLLVDERRAHRRRAPEQLVRGPLAELDGNAALRAISYRLGDLPDAPLPATLFLDGQLGLADDMLHYFDRASMAHSLEVRVPFLDHHVVELCATMPANLKVRAPRDEARPQARGARARARPDHRQAEDRLLQRRGRRLVPRADAGRDLATTCSGRTRATRRCSTGARSSGSSRARPTGPSGQHVRPPLGPDARGLAARSTCRRAGPPASAPARVTSSPVRDASRTR